MIQSRTAPCLAQVGYVSLAEVLRTRPQGLTELEIWALLCQSVQALQDLFLSDGISDGRYQPLVAPSSFLLSWRGRVILSLSRITPSPTHLDDFTAPEYRSGQHYKDTDIEKMLVFSLGQSLRRALTTATPSSAVPVSVAATTCHLGRVLTCMCRHLATERASLMHLLDVISEYSKRREQSKPFSHIVMDLYRETIIYRNNKLDNFLQNTCNQQPFSHRSEILGNVRNIDKSKTIQRKWRDRNLDQCLNCDEEQAENVFSDSEQPVEVAKSHVRPRSICSADELNLEVPIKTTRRRLLDKTRNPVRRAASRLYRAAIVTQSDGLVRDTCVGPEFVIRASMPSRELVLDDVNMGHQRTFTVILLNGVKIQVTCRPETTTAGQLFERIVRSEKLEENYFLGLSVLVSGDFVFLPSDIKMSKIITTETISNAMFTLFVRVRFFLPTLRGIRSVHSRHLLYLQLRRSILENQLPCTVDQLCELGGLALQAEFGDFSRKHEMNHYFLLEHYIPEVLMENVTVMEEFREVLTQGHIHRRGLSSEKAQEDFILLAQTLPFYGVHFYSANLVNKNTKKDVWISVNSHGISLFERKGITTPAPNCPVYEIFKWHTIQTLCYSKHFLCILPHVSATRQGLLRKYKLKMEHKKSYYTFRLASLHHQFFLRLRTEYGSLNSLSQQFGVLLKDMKNEANSLFKETSNTNAPTVKQTIRHNFDSRASKCRRSKSVNELSYNNLPLEEYQNKENENPRLLTAIKDTVHTCYITNTSVWDKRKGVKMGTRAFYSNGQRISRSLEAVNSSPNEEIEKMSIDSSDRVSSVSSSAAPKSDIYVLNSSIKSLNENFLPDFQESLNQTLIEKLKTLSFADERILKSVNLERDSQGSLGIEVTEGSDGKIYIQSIVPFGPASANGSIYRGDQIIAVNGLNLLNIKYNEALDILKRTEGKVELVLSQLARTSCGHHSIKILQKSAQHLQNEKSIDKEDSRNLRPVQNGTQREFLEGEHISNNYPYISYPTYTVTRNEIYKSENKSNEESKSVFCAAHSSKLNDRCKLTDTKLEIGQVALPRSMGLGRRWRGPVRYPVTPIKNPTQYPLNDSFTYLDTSSDEQIFI